VANDGYWHICDAQRMAPKSDQRTLVELIAYGKYTESAADC
jgi:hypothetical protein